MSFRGRDKIHITYWRQVLERVVAVTSKLTNVISLLEGALRNLAQAVRHSYPRKYMESIMDGLKNRILQFAGFASELSHVDYIIALIRKKSHNEIVGHVVTTVLEHLINGCEVDFRSAKDKAANLKEVQGMQQFI
jgi:hypothetical protein